ncbi:hypothetical protein [Vibrio campbellii]|uniref:hypothetical protein n=1 Tax=Vibrio campbellii TaxID=680 RepID=UPI0038CD57E9
MASKTSNNAYLIKTYCHLVHRVLPQANRDRIKFPSNSWAGIIDAINKAIEEISNELKSAGIDPQDIDCSKIE